MKSKTKTILSAIGLSFVGLIVSKLSNNNNEEIETPNKNYREKCFNGIPESNINDIAINISRGVKAVVVHDNLVKFYYRSGSGKYTYNTDNKLIDGRISVSTGTGPHTEAYAPRMFAEELEKEFN